MFCPLSPAPAHRPGHARSHAHAPGAAHRDRGARGDMCPHVNATVARGPCRHPCTHGDFRMAIFRKFPAAQSVCQTHL